MHFIRPEWLFALLPLALILLLLWRSERKSSTWNRYIAPHLANILVSQTNEVKRSKIGYLAFAWFIAVFALSGPALTKQSLPVFEAAQGRVIVMDMSLSMYATDLSPNRLSQAKFKANDLIDELKEGETGLVAYAGDAFTISPLTRDRATLLNLLPTLSPDIMPVRGSNLVAALEQGKNLLSQGGHIRGDILLLTDGVSTQQMSEAKSVLKDSQYRLAILALGSEQGSPIRLPDGQLLRDNASQVVVAKTNYSLLNELAKDSKGVLIPFRNDGEDLKQLQAWLSTTGDTKATELDGEVWQDAGPYIALLLLLPVLMSFRHGLVTAIALVIVYIPAPVHASSWNDLWKTQDQQAMQAYNAEDYQQAADTFQFPQWKASALYKAGEYDQALELFEQDDSATGFYNQGNSLLQQQNYSQAIERYETALAQAPDNEAIKANLELAKQLAQQQKESSDKDQSEQDPSDKNQDSQKDQQDEKSDQQDSDQGDQSEEQQQQNEPSESEQSSENGASEGDSSDKQENDAEMQAKPNEKPSDDDQSDTESQQAQQDKSDEQNQPEQQQSAAPQNAHAEEADDSEQAKQETEAAQMVEGPDELPPEMERALRALVDDPQVLLRNKMQLEYQKRARQNANTKEQQQW